MSEILKVGSRFSSFAEVKRAIEEFGEKTFTTFWKRDARTIAKSKIIRPLESRLIYYQLVYACNRGGKKFRSMGQKIRQSYTFKNNCPVHVRFTASSDGKALEVTSFEGVHNHETSQILHAHVPQQRRLPDKIKENAKDYLNMRANRKMVQQKLQETCGKIITLKDLTNMTRHDNSKTENLDNCINILQVKYGADVAVLRDSDNCFRGLLMQTPTIKNTFNAFPEFMALDATYKLLKISLPVFLIIVEDGNCQTEVVAVCILTYEDKESFTWFLRTFQRQNPAWNNVKCIMTDKDLTERNVIKDCFPDINLIICVFHTLKIFHREISCQKLGITPNERTLSLELIQKLVYAKTDEEYERYLEGLKNSVPSTVYEYFMKNWNANKDEWNLGKNYFKNNFLNNTNNRLESINGKLKSVINKNSSLEQFINSLFTIISSLEKERDHKAVYNILKKPVNMFSEDSPEKKYFDLLTREAAKHVLREIRLSKQIKEINLFLEEYYIIKSKQGSTRTTIFSCDCVIYNAMILPCKHIFALRRHLGINLFDATIVNQRWTMDYYKKKQRVLTSLVGEVEHESGGTSVEMSVTHHEPLSTYNQRRKKSLLLCTELSDLAAQRTGMLFEQRLNLLKNMKSFWANDISVAIVPIEVIDQNDRACSINGNDEVRFENASLQPINEENDEMLLKDMNENIGVDMVSLEIMSNQTSLKESCNVKTTIQSSLEPSEVCDTEINVQDPHLLSTIKMPIPIKKRGRPKGQDLTAIGLPKKKKRKVTEFLKRSYQEKQELILNFFVNNSLVKAIKNGRIIEESDIETSYENIPHSVLDDSIDIHLIRNFYTEEAFKKIRNLVEQKLRQQCWTCSVCSKDIETNSTNTIRCDACLLWRHICCTGLSRRPKTKFWFCRDCCNL